MLCVYLLHFFGYHFQNANTVSDNRVSIILPLIYFSTIKNNTPKPSNISKTDTAHLTWSHVKIIWSAPPSRRLSETLPRQRVLRNRSRQRQGAAARRRSDAPRGLVVRRVPQRQPQRTVLRRSRQSLRPRQHRLEAGERREAFTEESRNENQTSAVIISYTCVGDRVAWRDSFHKTCISGVCRMAGVKLRSSAYVVNFSDKHWK